MNIAAVIIGVILAVIIAVLVIVIIFLVRKNGNLRERLGPRYKSKGGIIQDVFDLYVIYM